MGFFFLFHPVLIASTEQHEQHWVKKAVRRLIKFDMLLLFQPGFAYSVWSRLVVCICDVSCVSWEYRMGSVRCDVACAGGCVDLLTVGKSSRGARSNSAGRRRL